MKTNAATPNPSKHCAACKVPLPGGVVWFCRTCFPKLPHRDQTALRLHVIRVRNNFGAVQPMVDRLAKELASTSGVSTADRRPPTADRPRADPETV